MKRASVLWLATMAAVLSGFLGAAASPGQAPNFSQALSSVTRLTGKEILSGPKPVSLPGGGRAVTVVLRQTLWELKDMPQSVELSARLNREAMRLPEQKRLERMNRTDDHCQLWWVGLTDFPKADATWKPRFTPEQLPNVYHRELIFLGKGSGYAWYAWMPLHEWVPLQTELRLADGDDPLAAAARGLSVRDRGSLTANTAEGYLTQGGGRALP